MKHVLVSTAMCVFFISNIFCQTISETFDTSSVPSTGSGLTSQETDKPAAPEAVPVVDSSQSTEAVPTDGAPSEVPQADITDPVPQIPAGERLLYFYPEPDPLYVAPIAPVASEKPAVKTAVPPKNIVKPAEKPSVKTVAPAESETVKASEKKNATDKTADKKASDAKASDSKTSAEKKSADVMPGIWTAEPTTPSSAAVVKTPSLVPSRKAVLALGQTLEVWYPGSGWVYLGDVSAQNGLGYENRKLDKADTLFTFKSLKPGDYILEFSRFDVLEDSYSSDTIAVTVTDDGTRKTGKVRAPDYRSAAPASSGATTGAAATPAVPAASTLPVQSNATASQPALSPKLTDEPALQAAAPATTGNTPVAQGTSDAAALLAKAKASLASGDAASALSALDSFFSIAIDSQDEGWFLRGQSYEANSPVRDIRKALAAYQTLVSAWPESSRWNEADARIRYIKQFYLGR